MSNAIATKPSLTPATIEGFTPDQIKLITNTIARGATPDELKLFLYRARVLDLDPLKPGQIYFIKYGNGPGTIVVGIEGFRVKASRTGKLAGVQRGVLKDEKGQCVGAWCEVQRHDWLKPAREEVPLDEYNTGRGNWASMPQTMIKKVAEAATLRMAFPDDLGGIYIKEEMDQAEAEQATGRIVPDQPQPGDGNTDNGYRISFGQWKGRSIEDVYNNFGPQKMADYIEYLEEAAKKKGQPLGSLALEFVEMASAYLGAMENAAVEEMKS